jgi:hypothetical protein
MRYIEYFDLYTSKASYQLSVYGTTLPLALIHKTIYRFIHVISADFSIDILAP